MIRCCRYFRTTWKESAGKFVWLGGNKDAWFVFHRLLMGLTWCLTLAAFFMIFAHLGWGWTTIRYGHYLV